MSPALALVEQLAEHLDPGDRGLLDRSDADDLHFGARGEHALLDPPGDHGAAPGDREHVLDRHQERLVGLPHRLFDVVVDGVHQLDDLVAGGLVAVERLERRATDHRDVVAGELVLAEQVADLELHEVEQLLVVHHVHLVEEHDDLGHPDLAGEQHVLPGLRHGAVGGRHHQDGAIDLGGAGDHVLDVVGVAGHVDVGVVAVLGLVLDVGDGDGDAALALLRGLVDLVEGGELGGPADPLREHLGDRRGQRRLAVVDVPHRAHVDVRLGPLELLLAHAWCSSSQPRLPLCCSCCVRSGGRT